MANRHIIKQEEYSPISDRYKAFREQTKTNNDIEKQDDPLDPGSEKTEAWTTDVAGERHGRPGLRNQYESAGINREDPFETSIPHSGLMQEGVQLAEAQLQGGLQTTKPPASNMVAALRDRLRRLSFRSSDGPNLNSQMGKRSMEDVTHNDESVPQPALKHRKTTRDFSTTSQPVADNEGSPRGVHSKLSGARMTSLAQTSNPALKISPGKQALLHRQKSWTHKALASRNVGKIGQSFSDPTQAQVEHDTISSSMDSQTASRRNSNTSDATPETPHTSIILQPDSKPMPENQLAAEIKALYSGLVMIESKCISVDQQESARLKESRAGKKPRPAPVNKDNNWPAIISLHRALLQEHHDFFLASQHPAASEPLRQLAKTYSMPERMWKHGIRSPLELFRFGLPDSKEFMIAFIILSYQMIGLLYETVSSFEDTWAECLGDLARYRMAIEDEDIKDREIWSNVSRSWYSKAAARQPRIGRLYHHQAILARTNPLKQLCFYARALNATQLFVNARESIMTLFEPILSRLNLPGSDRMTFDAHFIRLQAMIFTSRELDTEYDETLNKFLNGFAGLISEAGDAFKSQGEYIAHVIIADLFRWGSQNEPLRRLFTKDQSNPLKSGTDRSANPTTSRSRLRREWDLAAGMLQVILKRINDENILPLLLVLTAFFAALVVCGGVDHIDAKIPIDALAQCGNAFQLELERQSYPKYEPVILDTMYGQVWAEDLIPKDGLPRNIDHEDSVAFVEYPQAIAQKRTIVIMLQRMASTQPSDYSEHKQWISFDTSSSRFAITEYSSTASPTKSAQLRQVDNFAVVDPDTPLTYS